LLPCIIAILFTSPITIDPFASKLIEQ